MTRKDVPAVHRLLGEYLAQFHLAPVLNEEEVAHFLVPQENIIHTYVVEVSGPASASQGVQPEALTPIRPEAQGFLGVGVVAAVVVLVVVGVVVVVLVDFKSPLLSL